jgi:hypothetical protein
MSHARPLLRLAAALSLALAAPALAADAAPSKDAKKPRPRRVLKLEEMKVEGRIQKPQAMFLMPRARLDLSDLDRGESFLPLVTKAVEKDPF